MTDFTDNLLTQPLIHTMPGGTSSLPGVLAALSRDAIESYPALRPHQAPAWHMFVVQLAALALHRAGRDDLPEDEEEWRHLMRRLTPDFPDDEPWRLVVDDWSKPAFFQPPVPAGIDLKPAIKAPDALDVLETSKNHDVKQSTAIAATAEDWIFALVSAQTGGTYNVQNGGCIRTANIYAPRLSMGLAPPHGIGRMSNPSLGGRFRRDCCILLTERQSEIQKYYHIKFQPEGGVCLTWQEPWPADDQLALSRLFYRSLSTNPLTS
jgi:CRISPR system Cascade subunit CasA